MFSDGLLLAFQRLTESPGLSEPRAAWLAAPAPGVGLDVVVKPGLCDDLVAENGLWIASKRDARRGQVLIEASGPSLRRAPGPSVLRLREKQLPSFEALLLDAPTLRLKLCADLNALRKAGRGTGARVRFWERLCAPGRNLPRSLRTSPRPVPNFGANGRGKRPSAPDAMAKQPADAAADAIDAVRAVADVSVHAVVDAGPPPSSR